MTVGISLHVGLNQVDPEKYSGWAGPLAAAENDARDMAALAESQGFTPKVILTEEALAKRVRDEILLAVGQLKKGDIFLLTYAGHGGQVPDTNGDEKDHVDETWCLYDRQLVDDELADCYSQFAEGVRVVVISDSCHSGTVTRAHQNGRRGLPAGSVSRRMPAGAASRDLGSRKWMYDLIQDGTVGKDNQECAATVLLISGCQDNQESSDGKVNGLFTENLKAVWADGAFTGGYKALRDEVAARMPDYQTPNFLVYGTKNPAFESEPAFSLKPGGAAPKKRKPAKKSGEETALAFTLRLVGETGFRDEAGNPAGADSDIQSWFRATEAMDADLGLAVTRAENLVAQFRERFPASGLTVRALAEGTFATPAELAAAAV